MEEFLQQKKEILGDGGCNRSGHMLFNANLYQFRRFSYLRNTMCLLLKSNSACVRAEKNSVQWSLNRKPNNSWRRDVSNLSSN